MRAELEEKVELAGAAEGGAEGMFTALARQVSETIGQGLAALGEEMRRDVGEVTAQVIEMRTATDAPRQVERDAEGRIIAIGGRAVRRDANGLVESIG